MLAERGRDGDVVRRGCATLCPGQDGEDQRRSDSDDEPPLTRRLMARAAACGPVGDRHARGEASKRASGAGIHTEAPFASNHPIISAAPSPVPVPVRISEEPEVFARGSPLFLPVSYVSRRPRAARQAGGSKNEAGLHPSSNGRSITAALTATAAGLPKTRSKANKQKQRGYFSSVPAVVCRAALSQRSRS